MPMKVYTQIDKQEDGDKWRSRGGGWQVCNTVQAMYVRPFTAECLYILVLVVVEPGINDFLQSSFGGENAIIAVAAVCNHITDRVPPSLAPKPVRCQSGYIPVLLANFFTVPNLFRIPGESNQFPIHDCFVRGGEFKRLSRYCTAVPLSYIARKQGGLQKLRAEQQHIHPAVYVHND